MKMLDFDGPHDGSPDPVLAVRYRLLAFRLLANAPVARHYGIAAVALGQDHISIFLERDDPVARRELASMSGGDVELRVTGPIVCTARGGEDIQGRTGVAGTLGCIVRDAGNTEFGLSCDHVVGREAGQKTGDDVFCGSSNYGTFDRGSTIVMSVVASNRTDAALIALASPRTVARSIVGFPHAPAGTNRALAFGDTVKKAGATTGVTRGRFAYLVTMCVPYGSRSARFVDQIGIDGGGAVFSDKGDSGAVVLDGQDRVAGLLFASAPQSGLGFANRIEDIEADLGVTVA